MALSAGAADARPADVAVAIASERGLVAPVLRGVETLSPSAIASQVKAFVAQANAGRLQQRDLEGGSISVTNLGMFGVEEFSAIINPPQSAILAVGAGAPAPVVVDGAVEVAPSWRSSCRSTTAPSTAPWPHGGWPRWSEPWKSRCDWSPNRFTVQ